MKTELLNIYGIAQKIASIATGETRKSLATEIVKLTLSLQTKVPVHVLFNKKEKLIYTTIIGTREQVNLNDGYELIMIIERSEELNKYKITKI